MTAAPSKIARTLRVLDLYCGGGGAGQGYRQAGFETFGVDKDDHSASYPGWFHQGDAIDVLTRLLAGERIRFTRPDGWDFAFLTLGDFAFIHASPPCQRHTPITPKPDEHPELIHPTRELLHATSRTTANALGWVIENVPTAPMRADITLCGEFFGLGVYRHRIFEFSPEIARYRDDLQPEHLEHQSRIRGWRHGVLHAGDRFGVHGSGGGKGSIADWQRAMGITHTKDRREIAEAIPPAYTEHIGRFVLATLDA